MGERYSAGARDAAAGRRVMRLRTRVVWDGHSITAGAAGGTGAPVTV